MQNLGDNEIMFDSNINIEALRTAPRYDRNLYPDTEMLSADFSTDIDSYWADHDITID